MEKRIDYFSNQFNVWLRNTLISKDVNLFLMYDLKDSPILPEGFQVQIREVKNISRRSPIKKPMGYLVFPKEDSSDICSELTQLIFESIRDEEYTPAGIANILVLIDRLGSIIDSLQFEMSENICKSIPLDRYLGLVDEMINIFNKEYTWEEKSKSSQLSFVEWESLFFNLQYRDRMDNPIDIFRRVLNFRMSELPILRFISEIKPDVRVGLFEYGMEATFLDEQLVLRYLKKNQNEISFFAALATKNYSITPAYVGEEIIDYFITSSWDVTGKYLFRKTYDNRRGRINETIQRLLLQKLDSFLTEQFAESNQQETIIVNFLWPDDFIALGGWIRSLDENEKRSTVVFSNGFIRDNILSLTNQAVKITNNIPVLMSDSQSIYNMWFPDIFNLNAQYVSTYLMWSIFQSEEKSYKKFVKEFKNLCYKVKELYYGAYQANYIAQKISNCLLTLIFSFPKYENGHNDFVRLEELLYIFMETTGYQWIRYSERNEIIWNAEDAKIGFTDAELVYILKRLKDIPSPYLNHMDRFLNRILEYSTTKWPIDSVA